MSRNDDQKNSDIVIDVRHLSKSFDGKRVVEDLSMQVRRGRIHGFLGPNGSGKTTTIRMLCGLLTPDSGSGECLGYNILTEQSQIKRRTGYMTQRFSLYADLTIRENLEFIARVFGLPDPRQSARETSPSSASPAAPTNSRANFRAAGSSGWRWAPASCPSQTCCCSTSRPRASIPRRGVISGTRFTASPATASRCWCPPITWTRPNAATRSPISPRPSAGAGHGARNHRGVETRDLHSDGRRSRRSRGTAESRAAAERSGLSDDEVIEQALRRFVGLEVLDELWSRNHLSEAEAMEIATSELRALRSEHKAS